ncbi:pleiotropic regulatory protein RsmS [uncultured Shewanella sp.]|uniref:pleiotropic regulatory protein RsmS n=1 Tax=uncultured Shewanella sp. TaxID=173975 RepID=UPI00261FD15D|nr:pleiotropic regulatory protein RsmS [uncultured Shewanella sp.]
MSQDNDTRNSKEDHLHSLESASAEIKLAVDLIFLLESNEIDPHVALQALSIVKQDLEAKINQQDSD